ncbi:MAG: efflux RND transporter periplasmic adaptor subunit [Myxococcales bacterium]|nr:efflux RND transporter periplasmic adaptor subunit [Myxococcales bacterium]
MSPSRYATASLAAALAALLAVAGCTSKPSSASGSAAAGAQSRVPVKVLALAKRTLRPSVRVVADVAPWRKVTVAAEAAGRVRLLDAKVGEVVKAGALLVRVDASKVGDNLRLTRAQRDQAQATLDLARRQLTRIEKLARRGIVSDATLDAAKNRVRVAEASLAAARAQQRLTGRRHADSRIRAPFAATVAKRHVELGDYLAPGRPVVTLIDVSRVKVKAAVALADALAIKRGQRCEVRIKLLGEHKPLAGVVHTVGAAADPRSRRVEIEVALDNADGKLKPGLIAEVRFFLGAARSALLVPNAAIVEQFEVPYAFVVERTDSAGLGHARRRRLELGRRVGLETVVKRGLAVGERLVVVGQEGLADGTPVKVVTTASASKTAKR